jgi:hypothetical protein
MARPSSPPGKIMVNKRGVRYDREHQERTRQKIADSGVVDRVIQCMNGALEMSQGQISIALKLIDKLVPNLQSVEQEVTQNTPFAVLPAPAPSSEAWHKAFAPQKPTEARTAPKAAPAVPDRTKH